MAGVRSSCGGFQEVLFYFIFYYISFAKKKTKQTNGKNVDRDTATAVANYSGPGY